ncbi:hypothetical protein D3C77_610750 [compost metagenome]
MLRFWELNSLLEILRKINLPCNRYSLSAKRLQNGIGELIPHPGKSTLPVIKALLQHVVN